MKKSELILDILLKAIKKERDAYSSYIKTSEGSPYPETKALLAQLAEEERTHRKLLLREYLTLRGLLQNSKPRESYLTKDKVRYRLPSELPFKPLPTIPGIDLASISLPTEFMGGDYFEAIPFISANKQLDSVGIVLGDIMGHGLGVTRMKALIKSTLVELVSSSEQAEDNNKAVNAASLIARLNQLLWEPCRRADSYISLFYCVLNPAKRILVYSSAGHIPPILLTHQGSKCVSLANTQLVIGIMQQVNYTQTMVPLRKGDVLMLYTDGMTEAANKKGEEFGRKRLSDLAQQNYNLTSKEIIQKICHGLAHFLRDKPLQDELTIAVAKIV